MVAYRSGHFVHRDPFVAFLGLDVRATDSGKYKGTRNLTKHGQHFHHDYLKLQAPGLCKIAALVIIARKLARLAFSLFKNQTSFEPQRYRDACPAT